MTTVDTAKAEHRQLHFNSVDDVLAEVERIVAAERAGTLKRTGNWTAGQVFGHMAAWINYAYEGYPGKGPPWFVRILARMMKKSFLYKPSRRGFRMPGVAEGTFGTDPMSTAEGERRLREALARLKRREPVRFHSPAFGPMTDDERIAGHMRHAELHLGYLWP